MIFCLSISDRLLNISPSNARFITQNAIIFWDDEHNEILLINLSGSQASSPLTAELPNLPDKALMIV
jgi:hypothetical protein